MTNVQRRVCKALLRDHGQTYADAAGINLRNTPAPLFQLLYLSLLLSARISSEKAVSAAAALRREGLTTPNKMREASWQDRVDVITWNGYKRYDEKTATMLGELADKVLDDYRGDLRHLRAEACGDTAHCSSLLQRFRGIGPTGANIFLREVQAVWTEFHPFADDRVLHAAQQLRLGDTAEDLASLTARSSLPRLEAALVRVHLASAYDELRQAASV